jgi:hypothetical protein
LWKRYIDFEIGAAKAERDEGAAGGGGDDDDEDGGRGQKASWLLTAAGAVTGPSFHAESLSRSRLSLSLSSSSSNLLQVRELYERLLDRTQHVKVWASYAQFEASKDVPDGGAGGLGVGGGLAAARAVFRRAYDALKVHRSMEGIDWEGLRVSSACRVYLCVCMLMGACLFVAMFLF